MRRCNIAVCRDAMFCISTDQQEKKNDTHRTSLIANAALPQQRPLHSIGAAYVNTLPGKR